MFIWDSGSTDPYYNLAFEEYLLKQGHDGNGHVYLWQNNNAVIIGRYQNILAEVDQKYAKANKIRIVRRNSGGGAVFHDLGNLNYTFIRRKKPAGGEAFRDFLDPVIQALNSLGLEAVLSGRNDILLGGQKISGNSQYITGEQVLLHGTLLLCSDLTVLKKVLKHSDKHLLSKSTRSTHARVANMADFLESPLSVAGLKAAITTQIAKSEPLLKGELSERSRREILKLAQTKYAAAEWNYGSAPPYNITRAGRLPAGNIKIYMLVEEGKISQIHFEGDFIALTDITELAEAFTGCCFGEDNEDNERGWPVKNIGAYIRGVTDQEFYGLLYGR